MSTRIRLSNAHLSAEIDSIGAELRRLSTHDGVELLWPGDSQGWGQSAPLLFPVIGRLRNGCVLYRDRWHAMPPHGFAMHECFELRGWSETRSLWTLRSSPRTHALYPFDFRLDVEHALVERCLTTRVEVANEGDDRMPLSLGFHPGLRWPIRAASPAAHWIEFEMIEVAAARRPQPSSRLLGEAGELLALHDRRLHLDERSFAAGALVLDRIASRWVRFGDAEGPLVALSWNGPEQFALWSLPGYGFVCIEPWLGRPDLDPAQNGEPTHLTARWLEPGGATVLSMSIEDLRATECN